MVWSIFLDGILFHFIGKPKEYLFVTKSSDLPLHDISLQRGKRFLLLLKICDGFSQIFFLFLVNFLSDNSVFKSFSRRNIIVLLWSQRLRFRRQRLARNICKMRSRPRNRLCHNDLWWDIKSIPAFGIGRVASHLFGGNCLAVACGFGNRYCFKHLWDIRQFIIREVLILTQLFQAFENLKAALSSKDRRYRCILALNGDGSNNARRRAEEDFA